VSALKGFTSAVVDFDYMMFEDNGILVVVGEEVNSFIKLNVWYRMHLIRGFVIRRY